MSPGKLLRQRADGEFLEDAEEQARAPPAVWNTGTGPAGDHGVHWDLLQPPASAFQTRESLACNVCPAVGPSTAGSMRVEFMASTI